MKSLKLFIESLFIVMILSVASGCSFVVHVRPTRLGGGELLPHHVALVLDQNLASYEHKMVLIGGSDNYPMGEALQGYARNVTTESFHQVEVISTPEAAVSSSSDIILIPRVIKSDNSLSKFIPFVPPKLTMTLVVEWTAKSRTTGNIVWLKTITANATAPARKKDELFQRLFDDLSRKTYQAFQESSEFRDNAR
jgi:hypothetical protein